MDSIAARPDADHVAALAERLEQLERLVSQQQQEMHAQGEEIARLRAAPELPAPLALPMPSAPTEAATEAPSDPAPAGSQTKSRRALLKLGGAAAAAGVAVVAANGTAQAHSAASAVFTSTVSGTPACEGDGSNAATGIYGTSDSGIGVSGLGGGTTGIGVQGLAGLGAGVLGQSTSGYGVYAQSQSGYAVFGTTSSGTAGVAGAAGSTSGVLGSATSGSGVNGQSSTGIGVYGNSTSGVAGVQGHSASNVGVSGTSTSGYGVVGYSANRYGASFQGGLAPLLLQPGGMAGAPSSGAHQTGELYVDFIGVLWYCAVSGTPGLWFRITGVANGIPGGALNYLAAPIRIFDSRAGQPAPLPVSKAPLAGGNTYTIQVTGTTVGGLSVPAGATGVFGNLTVTNTQGGGDLILWPHGATQPLTSNINYSGGMTIANAVNVGLSSGGAMDLYVHVSGTDVIFDVAGYVL